MRNGEKIMDKVSLFICDLFTGLIQFSFGVRSDIAIVVVIIFIIALLLCVTLAKRNNLYYFSKKESWKEVNDGELLQ